MLTTEQKLLCALAHLGIFVGIPFLGPIIALLVTNDGFVKVQAKEAIGFQLGLSIITIALVIFIITIPLLIVLGIFAFILPIMAFLKILDGHDYSYPVSGPIIRKHFS